MPKVLKDKIIWDEDDWLAGLAPQFISNTPLVIGNGASYQRNVNPFRKLGAIVPGFAPVNATNEASITDILVSGDTDYSGATPYTYLVGGDKVQRLDISTDTISNTAPWPRTITHHATPAGKDLLIYNIINAVTSVNSTVALYSFSDATDGDVGMYDISSGALNVFDDDFLSTQPTGAFALTTDEHPMILGDDGDVYIGNGADLVKLKGDGGGNGTLSTALTFPNGTIIHSFTKYPQYLIIYASRSNISGSSYYRGNSVAYFWDYISNNFNNVYDLSDNLVTAGFNWNGIPGCFTYGRVSAGGSITTKLKLFNGSRFEQIQEYVGNPPVGSGSVEIHDNMIVWNFGSASQSFIASYGSPWPGRVKNSLNYWGEGQGTGQSLSISGVCKNFSGVKLYVSTASGANGGLQTFSANYGPNSDGASYFQAIQASLNLPSQSIGRIKSVKVHFRGIATAGRAVRIVLQANYGSSATHRVFEAFGTITAGDTMKEYFKDTNDVEFPLFHTIAPVITWYTDTGGVDNTDAPAVRKIEIFYDIVKFNQ